MSKVELCPVCLSETLMEDYFGTIEPTHPQDHICSRKFTPERTGKMKDYSESLIELENQTKQIHQHLLNKDWESALKLTDSMQSQVLDIRHFCIHQIKIDETADK